MKQAILDRVRILNKHVTNKLMIHLCGKRFGHFAILSHRGRKSGKVYRTPIIAEPVKGGFVIALTYGKRVDWYENVRAQGGGELRWKNRDYQLQRPEFVAAEEGLQAFPRLVRAALRFNKIEYFLKLEIAEAIE